MILARNCVPHCRIALPQDADAVTRYAAEELQHWLGQMLGSSLLTVPEGGAGDILLRQDPTMAGEAYRYYTEGGCLVIRGNGRGLLYGVYAFLEEELGIRFLEPAVTHVPRRSTLALPELDKSGAPTMEYREPSLWELRDLAFAARRRVNGLLRREDIPKYGPASDSFCSKKLPIPSLPTRPM